ncbi:MAG: class I SAM-dependent methyltransferase [Myxococcales bacterium]|nr:class I SAM-dependent methyltransferase [Myxococcales bacterium]
MQAGALYSKDFYRERSDAARLAARIVLRHWTMLFGGFQRVVDVGCGDGAWLAECSRLGATQILGVDGAWVPQDILQIPSASFRCRDLERPLDLARTFDLAISLEVLEHLPPHAARPFIGELVKLAPMVLFSAAIPGQGGTGHQNEQWQSHWASIFASYGYQAIDAIRPAIWTDEDVPVWYRQNILVYARPPLPNFATSLASPMLDVVHPELFEFVRNPPMPEPSVKGGLRGLAFAGESS